MINNGHPGEDEAFLDAQKDLEAEAAAEQDALEAEADAFLNAAEKNDGTQEAAGFADPLEFLQSELEKLEADKTELHEKNLLLAADMQNLRRRTAKDVKDAREYSIAGFAREMLDVSDNLRRGLEAIPEDARNPEDANFKTLIEGVEMTERAMMLGLEKHGVKKLNPENERFNPNLHQAMFEIPNTEVPNNTVLQVVQSGYVIGERCLRPAMVGVSKGGPKHSDAAGNDAKSEGDA
ncbi:MAG: nucleotide exchange factor GrpE [Nitratireductor sp.]